jgi:hypothetical protein
MSRAAVIAGMAFALAAPVSRAELADVPSVDVEIRDQPPPRRHLVVEWNGVPLLVGRLTLNLVVAPADHHALVLSPFYAWAHTQPVFVFDDSGRSTQLPRQSFIGGGCDVGYRYYLADHEGPRGAFMGASFLLGRFTASAMDGSRTRYLQLGGAADLGYQILVLDRLALSLIGGVQYAAPTKDLPRQQFPARLVANAGVIPRLFLTLGWAF